MKYQGQQTMTLAVGLAPISPTQSPIVEVQIRFDFRFRRKASLRFDMMALRSLRLM